MGRHRVNANDQEGDANIFLNKDHLFYTNPLQYEKEGHL